MEKVTDELLIELAKLAYREYGDLPATYEQACKHNSGDGLADFIVTELVDGTEETENGPEKLANAIKVMTTAKEQLDAVLMILTDAQAQGIERTMKAWQ